MRVLVVEDEVKLAGLIRRGLREEGVLADVAIKGEDALWMAEATVYDVVVLDLMLPGIDGFETCRRLRGDGVRTPILMLTARDAVEDRIAGLDTGADDYLAKPFDFGELLARLRALARRGPAEHGAVLRVGDLELDPARPQRAPRRHRDPAVNQGVPAPRGLHAPTRRGALALPAAGGRVGHRVRAPLERDRRLRALPAREGRPTVRSRRRSRPSAARATGSSEADPRTAHRLLMLAPKIAPCLRPSPSRVPPA